MRAFSLDAIIKPAADESTKPETGKEDASVEGNGDGNGQVPPGQTEDGDGNIVNNGGNMAPGLNRGEHIDKPDNPNKPDKPENPGTEDSADSKVNKANSGTHIYTYDELNRMVSSEIAKELTNYTYDTLGNLVLETSKNKSVDYEYNELNQLVRKTTSTNEVFTYTYDARGNRIAETGKKASQSFVYDATNRLVEGTNWKGDTSAYTYNGLGLRVNNLVTTHAGQTYDRDYVIDYTSPENDDLYVYAMGNGQLEYEQRHVYAGSERIEQITEKGNGGWERTLYVHEDVMGNTRYYTKSNDQSFAELQYDAWGQPVSPNKLVNNDHGNYVFATFTGHIYDPVLDIYFAEARFYDSTNRTWMAMDPIKDGLNWYQYVNANPITYWDALGLSVDLPPVPDGIDPSHNAWYLITNHDYGFVHREVQNHIEDIYSPDILAEQPTTSGNRVDLVSFPVGPERGASFWEVKPSSYATSSYKYGLLQEQMARYEGQTIEFNEGIYDLYRAQTTIAPGSFPSKINGVDIIVSYWNPRPGEVYYTFQPAPKKEHAYVRVPSIESAITLALAYLYAQWYYGGGADIGLDTSLNPGLSYFDPYTSCLPSVASSYMASSLPIWALVF